MTAPESLSTSARLGEALVFAERLHRGQIRKKTLAPTLSHLLAVAALVLEHGGDEEETIAALLHDGPEDCQGRRTLEEIRARFGERVAEIVEGCTDSLATPRPPWEKRKRRYLEHLASASPSTLLVSLADKVHNVGSLVAGLRSTGDGLWERLPVGPEPTLCYYRALLSVFREQAPPRCARLVEALARSLTEMERLLDAESR